MGASDHNVRILSDSGKLAVLGLSVCEDNIWFSNQRRDRAVEDVKNRGSGLWRA